MRITEQMRYDGVARNLSQLSSRQAKAAQEVLARALKEALNP